MQDSIHVIVYMPRGDAHALWHAKVPQLQLQNEGAAKKMHSRETVS